MARARSKSTEVPKTDRPRSKVSADHEDANRLEREYWWSRTPAERMAALELARQKAYGYTPEKRPRFVRTMRVMDMCRLN